ncbi:MAG: hypothetical protein PVH88_16985 [Ignavibacteria bacterium]|jgi:uncharacterized membrane protein YvbJ
MPETKKCPYCSEEILADARKCKHCGEYLDDTLKAKAQPQETKIVAKEGCFLQTLNAGCIIIAVIIVVIILIGIIASLQR